MSRMSGLSRGLSWTEQEGENLPFLAKTNTIGIPIVPGLIVTNLELAYPVTANVSLAFVLLSAITITLYLIMYMPMNQAKALLPRRFVAVSGVNPVSGKGPLDFTYVLNTPAEMAIEVLYDISEAWRRDVDPQVKRGVGGEILAISPDNWVIAWTAGERKANVHAE